MMRGQGKIFLFWILAAIWVAEGSATENTSGVGNENQLRQTRVAEATSFSVRVISQTANLFSGETEQGHGTGFIVEMDNDFGYIFTNRHVIAKDPMHARRVTLQFASGEGEPETAEGKVVFQSALYDFAVIKFKKSELKRVRSKLRLASLPSEQEMKNLIVQGRAVMTFGYPLDGDKIASFGMITGLSQEVFDSKEFISVDAAINPGNSGGPLIDLETGKVIGINSAKSTEGEGMGYVIPLKVLQADWARYREDPEQYGLNSYGYISWTNYGEDELEVLKVQKVLEKAVPQYFSNFGSALVVSYVAPKSPLQVGDILVKIDGEVIGNRRDFIGLRAHFATSDHSVFTVIRNGKLTNVEVPVRKTARTRYQRANDFVLVSGLLVQELTPAEREATNGGRRGLIVRMTLPNSPAENSKFLTPGDVLTEVQLGNRRAKLRTLQELKDFLASAKEGDVLQFAFRPSVRNQGTRVVSSMTGKTLYHAITAVDLLPVTYVVTPEQLSLKQFRKKFDFTGYKPNESDWRYHLKKGTCKHVIASLK